MYDFAESERQRERLFQTELGREINPLEREFLEAELNRMAHHHETMKALVDNMPELEQRPILLIDATDKGTVGSTFFTAVNPELVNFFLKIQTGTGYNLRTDKFDYQKFCEQTFKYQFGLEPDDRRFQVVRAINPQSQMPDNPENFSLILGSGGEVNHLNTQAEYVELLNKIKPFFRKMLDTETPFAVTCATHQIVGQVAHERAGQDDMIIEQLYEDDGKPIFESGVIDLFIDSNTQTDNFELKLPSKISVLSNHGQYLAKVPEGAHTIATNQFKGMPINTQMLAYKNGVGFQAHPEFSEAVDLIVNRLQRAQAAWDGNELPEIHSVDPRPTWELREKIFPQILQMAHKVSSVH